MITLEDIKNWSKEAAPDYVDPDLLYAIAQVESSLEPKAVSRVGAEGLFQFMPITQFDLAERFKFPFDPYCPRCSTIAAVKYLSWLMSEFPDNLNAVLMAWNWGYGNTQRYIAGVLTAMPKETRDFIKKVRAKYTKEG
jgi:soluble lytic murein transglycosylase-like protein